MASQPPKDVHLLLKGGRAKIHETRSVLESLLQQELRTDGETLFAALLSVEIRLFEIEWEDDAGLPLSSFPVTIGLERPLSFPGNDYSGSGAFLRGFGIALAQAVSWELTESTVMVLEDFGQCTMLLRAGVPQHNSPQ